MLLVRKARKITLSQLHTCTGGSTELVDTLTPIGDVIFRIFKIYARNETRAGHFKFQLIDSTNREQTLFNGYQGTQVDEVHYHPNGGHYDLLPPLRLRILAIRTTALDIIDYGFIYEVIE